MAGRPTAGAIIEVTQLFGTAFKLSNGRFLTAGHVFENGLAWTKNTGEDLFVGITQAANTRYRWHTVIAGEVYSGIDCAVLDCPTMPGNKWEWCYSPQPALSSVFALGYAFGWDQELNQVRVRAFKGSIVAYTTLSVLPGSPKGYELSFACSKNLSGAPLLTDTEVPQVIGIVVGNSKTSMLVHASTEILEDGAKRHSVEQHEVLNLGNAVCATECQGLVQPGN